MLVIKQLFPIKQLFKVLTLDNFNTKPRKHKQFAFGLNTQFIQHIIYHVLT